jgi:hypothetical protein
MVAMEKERSRRSRVHSVMASGRSAWTQFEELKNMPINLGLHSEDDSIASRAQ